MPGSYAHYRFGCQLLPTLPANIRRPVQRFRRMFDMGLHGPDLFFYHNIFVDDSLKKLGQKLHHMTGREFFTLVCRRLRLESSEAGQGFSEEKPEHMTHLNGDVLVPKTHPRIRFRGMMDRLEAELLLCGKETGEILALARRLIRCDVMEEPVGEFTLYGLTQEQQRKRSHFPQDYYGIPHFMPDYADGEPVLRLNMCRSICRQTELAAVEAFSDRDGNLTRADIVQALNRMSSMLYILMIRRKSTDERH